MKYITIVFFSLLFLTSCGNKQQVQQTEDSTNQVVTESNLGDDSQGLSVSEEDALIEDVLSGITDETVVDNSSETMMNEVEKEKMMQKDELSEDTMAEKDTMEKVAAAGVYANYDASLVGKTANTVIFFHATWCPSCRALDAGISSGTLPAGLTVLKADYDSETELKKKYGVLSQHTLVYVDAQGNEIKKWAGGSTIESITEKLN